MGGDVGHQHAARTVVARAERLAEAKLLCPESGRKAFGWGEARLSIRPGGSGPEEANEVLNFAKVRCGDRLGPLGSRSQNPVDLRGIPKETAHIRGDGRERFDSQLGKGILEHGKILARETAYDVLAREVTECGIDPHEIRRLRPPLGAGSV